MGTGHDEKSREVLGGHFMDENLLFVWIDETSNGAFRFFATEVRKEVKVKGAHPECFFLMAFGAMTSILFFSQFSRIIQVIT